MYQLNKDEFIVLSSKVNSPTLTSIVNGAQAEDEAAATASLAEKGVLEGNAVTAAVAQLIEIFDNAPETKVTRYAPAEIPKATTPDMGGEGGDGGGGGLFGFGASGGLGLSVDPRIAAAAPKIPSDVLAQKGDQIAVIGHTVIKEWAKKYITYTLDLLPKEKYFDALKDYLGFIETADSQMLRKFTSNVNQKSHDAYISTFLNKGPNLAIKRHRRGYGLSTMEMYQLNGFLSNVKENFRFKYEIDGKEIPGECLRSGVFQIVSFPSKNLFGSLTTKFCHLGMVKSFSEMQKTATV